MSVAISDDGFLAAAGHDGYNHLPGRPLHRRSLRLNVAGVLEIEDLVEGDGVHDLQGGFLVAEAWEVTPTSSGWALAAGDFEVHVRVSGPTALERFVEVRPRHPEHGVERFATRLGWRCRVELPFTARGTWRAR